jgi:hypothetical protein
MPSFFDLAANPSPAPAAAPPPAAPAPASSPGTSFFELARKVNAPPKQNPIMQGLNAVGNVLSAPHRALEAGVTGGDVGHALMHPEDQAKLEPKFDEKIGLTGLDKGILAGDDWGHKALRGVAHFGADVLTDPTTYIPGGAVGKLAKLVPGVEALGDAAKGSKLFNASADIEPLVNDQGKFVTHAAYGIANHEKQKSRQAALAVVRQHADEIKNGVIHPDVQALFARDPTLIPAARKGMNPHEVTKALEDIHSKVHGETFHRELEDAFNPHPGLFGATSKLNPTGATLTKAGVNVDDALAAAKQYGKYTSGDNAILKGAHKLSQLGSKAFLATAFPHAFNETDLMYQKYGLPVVVKGLANAARIGAGGVKPGSDLAKNIKSLEAVGAHAPFEPVFDELGITRVAGIPHTEVAAQLLNKLALIPAQRFSNFLQEKALNSVEGGLSAAALDAERAAGHGDLEAGSNIAAAVGKDAPTGLTHAASEIGQPFAHFHTQTVPGQMLKTLANNPSRLTVPGKLTKAYSQQFAPPTAQFKSGVPGQKAEDILANPFKYIAGSAGPLGKLADPYGPIQKVQKGKVGEAIGDEAQYFIPLAPEMMAAVEALQKKKGRAGENPLWDLIPDAVTGGYWVKKKPGQ